MPGRRFLGQNNILKLQVGLLQNFFEPRLMLICKRYRISYLYLTLAKDAASDGDTFLRWVMSDSELTLVSIATAILLV